MISRVAALLALWNLAGYPLFLLLYSRLRTREAPWETGDPPRVSVMIAAHDEGRLIGRRVRNILEQRVNFPVEVIVVSDGSVDDTAAEAAAAGATVITQPRSGKIAALHRAVEASCGEVLVVTDANTRFGEGALAALVAAMADPRVGIAAGDLRYENPDDAASSWGESVYWSYETAIKRAASDCGLLLMGAGGIYALRRDDWPVGLPVDLADDSFVPLSLHRAGRRNVFVPDAVAWERAGTTMEDEWRRRVRMVAQDARVARVLSFGLPNSATCFALVSQKVLRWMIFPLLVLGSPVILEGTVRVASDVRRALGPVAPLLLGAGGAFLGSRPRMARRVAGAAFYLVGATIAAACGLALGMAGRSPAVWKKAGTTRE